MNIFQTTLKKQVTFEGFGVHSGKKVTLVVKPAEPNHKIVFIRKVNDKKYYLPADLAHVNVDGFCTELLDDGCSLKTIEHLMAAIAGLGIDNLEIEVDAEEIPILDGSAHFFVETFEKIGLISQKEKREYIRILKPIRTDFSFGYAEFLPYEGQRYDVSISFASRHIQKQSYIFNLNAEIFKNEIARARTFGFKKDAAFLKARGLANGSSLENSIIIDEDDVLLNKDGLFYADEFVRHKLLDAIGDLSLLSRPFIGCFRSFCSGHRYNIEVSRMLLENEKAYEIITLA